MAVPLPGERIAAEVKAASPRPLSLWVIVAQGEERAAPIARLATALAGIPGVRLERLLTVEPPAAPRGALAVMLALEQRLLPSPMAEELAHAPVPPAEPLATAEASGERPDLVIDLAGGDAGGALGAQAPMGLWRLDAFGTPPIAAAAAGAPVTQVCLIAVDGQGPRVIARCVYDSKPLMGRNAAYVREKSVQLVEQALRRWLTKGELSELGAPEPAPALPAAPGLGAHAARVAANALGRLARRMKAKAGLRPQPFHLAIGPGEPLEFDPARLTEIVPQGNRYWADPFLIAHEGRLYLFFEDYDYATGKGHISVGLVEDGRFRLIGPALVRPYHLSFPFVFAHGGDVWMLPETSAARRLELWRAVEFPTRWELAATALEGVAVADSVLVEVQGRWWLFTNICRDSFGDFCAELHLFEASGPDLARLQPHPLNPVVIGSDRARGGGRVFTSGGRLYRTAQDNSGGTYGYGLKLMEIERLTPTDYVEREVRHIAPDFAPGLIGCHHMDAAGGQVVIDMRRR